MLFQNQGLYNFVCQINRHHKTFFSIDFKQRTYRLLFLVLCILMSYSLLTAQTYKINKYGLKLIDNITSYQSLIKSHPAIELVNLTTLIPHLKTNWVYATENNFTHKILYEDPAPYLCLKAAKALAKVANQLEKLGLGILIYDAYRPYSVTVKMWEVVPDNRYAANPSHGSGHNRGLAVDLSLYDLQTGQPLAMPTGFDDFTQKAHQDYDQFPEEVLKNRALLKKIMTHAGFNSLRTEWWHYTYPGTHQQYPLIDLSFQALHSLKQ